MPKQIIDIQPMLLIPLLSTSIWFVFSCIRGWDYRTHFSYPDCLMWPLVYPGWLQPCIVTFISVSLMLFLGKLFSELPAVIFFHVLGKPVGYRKYFPESTHKEFSNLVRCKEHDIGFFLEDSWSHFSFQSPLIEHLVCATHNISICLLLTS